MRRLITTQVQQPAAGADWSFIPSEGDYVRVLAITATFVTSATVANRAAHLAATDPNGLLLDGNPAIDYTTASKTATYVWDDAASAGFASADQLVLSQSVPRFWLPPGTKVGTVTTGIDTTDQWSAIVATFLVSDEWHHLQVDAMLERIAEMVGGGS